jgi:hypothetical protein
MAKNMNWGRVVRAKPSEEAAAREERVRKYLEETGLGEPG